MKFFKISSLLLIGLISASGLGASAFGGVFDLPFYIEEGEGAIGIEPEVSFFDGADVGANLYYSRGISELAKLGAVVGTGSGVRGFRFGARMGLDIFPDADGQPGLGLGTQLLYSSFGSGSRFDVTFVPFVHKAFQTRDSGYEFVPFFAFPFGFYTGSGLSGPQLQAVVGSLFRNSDTLSFISELGISVHNSETYVSGGVVIYHQ